MTYTFEIEETKESLPLIAHLKTLKYVKQKNEKEVIFDDKALAKAVKAAEKGASIPWTDFKREAKTWKSKVTK
jgi:hypothetical protein